jgi:hypothetical protein
VQAVVGVLKVALMSRRIPKVTLVYPISRFGGTKLWCLRNKETVLCTGTSSALAATPGLAEPLALNHHLGIAAGIELY